MAQPHPLRRCMRAVPDIPIVLIIPIGILRKHLIPQIAQVIIAIEASGGLDADAVPEMKKHSTQFRDEFSLDKDD